MTANYRSNFVISDHFKKIIISASYFLTADSALDVNNKRTIAFKINLGLGWNGRESQAVLEKTILFLFFFILKIQ
jgi:hypothetical protein